MINKKMEEAINSQINAELYSAYLYLSMSAYFQEKNLPGFASWMESQAAEEMFHAKKFYNYVIERGGRGDMRAIEAPPKEWKSTVDVFEETLKHEQHVTALINGLVDLAIELKDHASNNMLQWFIAEQVEEEATSDEILNKVKMIVDSKSGMYQLDKEMSTRQFNVALFSGTAE
ncbi:MAG: ferritin [Bacteroidales bacterium]|nr:ferritin [Bacteroidales bacterium]